MAGYITTYNSVDLSNYGLTEEQVNGAHDLYAREITKDYLPGSDIPHVSTLYRVRRQMTFPCYVANTNHATIVANLASIRDALMPDDDFHALVVADRANQQIQALCMGVPIDIPAALYNIWKFPVTFEVYPHWEDVTAQTLTIGSNNVLSFNQATFELATLAGWNVVAGGTLTQDTIDPYSGLKCMKVVAASINDGALTDKVTLAVGGAYSLGFMAKGAVGGEEVMGEIEWFTAGDASLGKDHAHFTLTDDWALYKLENKTTPGTTAKATILIQSEHAGTIYVDEVGLRIAATYAGFIMPYDANTVVPNAGNLPCYPTYTCAVTDTLASGLWFQVGSVRFAYEGALANADALVVDADPSACSVKLNGTADMANTDLDAHFPALAVGNNAFTCSDITKFSVGLSHRRRYK